MSVHVDWLQAHYGGLAGLSPFTLAGLCVLSGVAVDQAVRPLKGLGETKRGRPRAAVHTEAVGVAEYGRQEADRLWGVLPPELARIEVRAQISARDMEEALLRRFRVLCQLDGGDKETVTVYSREPWERIAKNGGLTMKIRLSRL